MKQLLFQVPGLGIPVHGFDTMLVVATALGIVLAGWRARRERLSPDVVYDLVPWIVFGGLAGARAFHVWEYWGETLRTPADAVRVWDGGLVFYGALTGGLFAISLVAAARGFPRRATRAILDALTPSLALGIVLGRLGCYLNGCCYGKPFRPPGLGVAFPRDSPPWIAQRAQEMIPAVATESLPIHAAQLYESANGLAILLLLLAYYPARRRDGAVFGLFLLVYPASRFFLEAFRDDETTYVLGMTSAQITSLFAFAIGLLYRAITHGRGPRCDQIPVGGVAGPEQS